MPPAGATTMLAPEILPIVSTTFWMSVFSNENVVTGGFSTFRMPPSISVTTQPALSAKEPAWQF